MNTPAYRRRRQLARQRRHAAEVESRRRWREQVGVQGFLATLYPPDACRELMAMADKLTRQRWIVRPTPRADYELRFSSYCWLSAPVIHRVGSVPEDRYSVPLDLELPEWRDRANAGPDEFVSW